MKILYICHRIPYPPNKGEKIRAFHQLEALGSRHEVELFTLADQPVAAVDRNALRQYCSEVTVATLRPLAARLRALCGLLSTRPLTLPHFYSSPLREAVSKAIQTRGYDRIFVYCSAMAQYVDGVTDIPIISDLVDVDSAKWAQYAASTAFPGSAVYRTEANRLRRYEREICRRSSFVVVTTEQEARLVREISPDAAVEVIGNGVDVDFFKPQGVRAATEVPRIVFTGDMSYFPNEDAVVSFVARVLPLVRQSVPDAQFSIVGRNPTRKVRELANVPGVEVTGFVPDVRPWLERASVAVAPFSIAAGIQNKVLEALAYGRPVVASRKVLQSLAPAVAGIIRSGDSPEELAAEVVNLLRDPALAEEIGAEGRRRVTSEYNWKRWNERLLALVENAALSGPNHAGRGSGGRGIALPAMPR